MKMEKKISLHAFEVEYIDQREPSPHLCTERASCWTAAGLTRLTT